jgi:hypothetical protein
MNAEQPLEFLEQHMMGEEAWQAFQAELHASVQQMHEGISRDELEGAVQHISQTPAEILTNEQRLSQSPAEILTKAQQLNQVINRFRVPANTQGAASTDEKSEAPERADKSERHPR